MASPEIESMAFEAAGGVLMDSAQSPDEDVSVSDIYKPEKDDGAVMQADTGDEAAPNSLSLKRKADEVSAELSEEATPKRARQTPPTGARSPQRSYFRDAPRTVAPRLPAEIWHHIFKRLPPHTLGTLLSVNKLFHRYLDPSVGVEVAAASPAAPPSASSPSAPSSCKLPPTKPDAIWQASRRLFWPRMPAPLKGRSEVDMWRICCSRSCQFCKFRDNSSTGAVSSADHWHRGPGPNSVVPVFPFFVVSCGRCLADQSVKVCNGTSNVKFVCHHLTAHVQELDVFLTSSIPSVLLPALSVVFLTPEHHIIPPQVLYSESDIGQKHVAKVFWQDQIDKIKSVFETVKDLGPAAAGEWIKGLDSQGKRLLADAARWEKWHLSGGVNEMRSAPARSKLNDQTTRSYKSSEDVTATSKEPDNEFIDTSRASSARTGGPQHCNVQKPHTMEEVSKIKSTRQAEIERRAKMLQPPIAPNVLSRMPSFHTALQIGSPLDDQAWELLLPRLMMEREEAERLEMETLVMRIGHACKYSAKPDEAHKPKKVLDAEWNEAQGPVRARIARLADEFIRDSWDNGQKVKKKNVQQFAAAVLLYVRKKFYDEIAQDNAAAYAAGRKTIVDPPAGPWTQKLTMENMKWTFDMKVRPRTDRFRKDLFVCYGCDNSSKLYSFDAVVQHYAAKHTDALSVGNVVVHWRAEWPAFPIFAPYPKSKLNKANQNTTHGKTVKHVPDQSSKVQPADSTVTTGHVPITRSHDHDIHGPRFESQRCETNPQSYDNRGSSAGFDTHTVHKVADDRHKDDSSHQAEYKYKTQLDLMAKTSRRIWDTMAKAKDLPDAVKACVLLHHVSKDFEGACNEFASLNMFIDGLSNNTEMRMIRRINRLRCKACMTSASQSAKSKKEKKYMLPLLLDHFRAVHSEQSETPPEQPLDWRVDMVWLPATSEFGDIRVRMGDDSDVLDAISDALPWAFAANSTHMYSEAQEGKAESTNQLASDSVPTHWAGGPRRWRASDPVVTNSCGGTGNRGNKNQDGDVPQLQPASAVYGNTTFANKPLPDRRVSHFSSHDVPLHASSASLERDGFEILGERIRQAGGHLAGNGTYHSQDRKQQHLAIYISEHRPDNEPHPYPLDQYWEEKRREAIIHQPHMPHTRGAGYSSITSGFPMDSFEIVEVRDPRGDYLIKRPIIGLPQAAGEVYARPYQQHNTDAPQSYNYPVHNTLAQQHPGSSYVVGNRLSRPSRSDYEDYDPRYPAVANPHVPRENRYCDDQA